MMEMVVMMMMILVMMRMMIIIIMTNDVDFMVRFIMRSLVMIIDFDCCVVIRKQQSH